MGAAAAVVVVVVVVVEFEAEVRHTTPRRGEKPTSPKYSHDIWRSVSSKTMTTMTSWEGTGVATAVAAGVKGEVKVEGGARQTTPPCSRSLKSHRLFFLTKISLLAGGMGIV